LGGDDRNGVFLIKNLVNEGYRPHIVLTHDEEIGGAGANSFLNDFPTQDHIKLGIGIDRGFHGGEYDPTKDKLNQVVYYNNDSQDTKDFFTNHGFANSVGSTSDIKKIGDKYEIPYANVSAAYINEHTSKELTNVKDLNEVYGNLKNIMNENGNLNLTYKKKEYPKYTFIPSTSHEENDYDWENYQPANHPINTIKNIDINSNEEVND
jgi:putative aminopeptidase FrvX